MNITETLISNDNETRSMLKITMNGRRVGDITTFSCPIGFGLKGRHEIICLESGQWSATVPICQGLNYLFNYL
jgi:hypothetical protein